ncbi:MAG: cobalamin-independent methionine synthase II family protein [Fimbriimonadaceae bacterium]|nr:cobalamin-independent methionine synthase II family protein [Fimbriimonadaceae bacterium]
MSAAPFPLTTVVGSYPLPAWLAAAPSSGALRDAMMVVLKTQELAGIELVADGELYRFDINHPETNGMIDYFIRPLGGLRTALSRSDLEAFRRDHGLDYRAAPAGVVEGPITEGTLNLPADYLRVKPLTKAPLKFTLTGPHMLAKVLTDRHYRDRSELALALARVLRQQVESIDAAVVQVDEANITGHPEEAEWAAVAVNEVLAGIKTAPALHLCFGNYGGQTIQQGTWDALIGFLNALHVDHVVLEFARRGEGELPVLREVRPEIGIGLGVIDIKDNGIETADTVARRIEAAARVVGAERIRYVHPDCGFWMLQRNVADGKMRALVAGRDRWLGR